MARLPNWEIEKLRMEHEKKQAELTRQREEAAYWKGLEHEAAIAALQGMLNNSLLITGLLKVNKSHEDIVAEVTDTAIRYANVLVKKMKETK